MSDYHNGEEAYRLAAWLKEGAFHKMTLGDVEKAGRLLIKLQERLVEIEKEYDASMVHQNRMYNQRVAERDELFERNRQLISETSKYCAEVSLGKSATIGMGIQLDEAKESINALTLALEVERDAANLYAKQVAHWIEKHDALLAQQLATSVPPEWTDKSVIAYCVSRGILAAGAAPQQAEPKEQT